MSHKLYNIWYWGQSNSKSNLKYTKYSHDPDQSEDLTHSAHHQGVLHSLQHKAKIVREDGKQVNNIEGGAGKWNLLWSTSKSDDVLWNVIELLLSASYIPHCTSYIGNYASKENSFCNFNIFLQKSVLFSQPFALAAQDNIWALHIFRMINSISWQESHLLWRKPC